MKEVKVLKLYNGEMIIGEVVTDLESIFSDCVIDNPRSIAIVPNMAGGIQLALTSVCAPFKSDRLKQRIVIHSVQVLFILNESELDQELIKSYKSEISGIAIATAADRQNFKI